MAQDSRTVEYHLVHSIKGGCGKSANAFFLALQEGVFSKKNDSTDSNKSVCLVDADFRGTGLNSIYEKLIENSGGEEKLYLDNLTKKPDGTHEIPFYTDSILSKQDIDINKCICRMKCDKPKVATSFKEGWQFDLALCNPNTETKNAFVTNTSHVDGNTIDVGYFTKLYENFLIKLAAKYDVIVIDMSPGVDEYTKSIFDAVYSMYFEENVKKYCKKYKSGDDQQADCDVKVKLHHVTTRDRSHVDSTANEVVKVLTERKLYEKGPDTINIILCETSPVLTASEFDSDTKSNNTLQKENNGSESVIKPSDKRYYVRVAKNAEIKTGYEAESESGEISNITDIYDSFKKMISNKTSGLMSGKPEITFTYRPYLPEYDGKTKDGTDLLETARIIAGEKINSEAQQGR